MRCEDARTRRAARAPSDLHDAQLAEHLRECEACRRFDAQHASLDRVLALDEPHVPGPGFDTRFFARLDAERTQKRTRSRLRWAWMLAPAAIAATVVLLRARAPQDVMPSDEELELAMELELVEEVPTEDLAVVEKLDEIEALDVLAEIDDAELERIVTEVQ